MNSSSTSGLFNNNYEKKHGRTFTAQKNKRKFRANTVYYYVFTLCLNILNLVKKKKSKHEGCLYLNYGIFPKGNYLVVLCMAISMTTLCSFNNWIIL